MWDSWQHSSLGQGPGGKLNASTLTLRTFLTLTQAYTYLERLRVGARVGSREGQGTAASAGGR